MRKAVIIFPFRKEERNVGNLRVDRFVEFCKIHFIYPIIVFAGSETKINVNQGYTEFMVKDILGVHKNDFSNRSTYKIRKQNRLRRKLAYILLNPDPSVVWGLGLSFNKRLLDTCKDSAFILSSSPPESAHFAAYVLSKKLSIPLIVDLRDGWTDEPLKPILKKSKFRFMLERRLETKILYHAKTIFVTSKGWKDMLSKRLKTVEKKVYVLTNGYPNIDIEVKSGSVNQGQSINLVHLGRFRGSSEVRTPDLLLKTIYSSFSITDFMGKIEFYGELDEIDLSEVNQWKDRFANINWELLMLGQVSNKEAIEISSNASGLLLLSVSVAAIPSKFFEYLIVRRPILIITLKESSLWDLCSGLPQVYLVDYQDPPKYKSTIISFLERLKMDNGEYLLPEEYRTENLCSVFVEGINSND